MKAIGIDIGTTSISGVVYDTDHGITGSITRQNHSFLPGHSWERIQDPLIIEKTVTDILTQLLQKHSDISAIGVTGQMHGILYLDSYGQPVSPLYTWQDGRGDLLMTEDDSYAGHLTHLTGCALSTGYGLVTHYYNLQNDLIPEKAVVLCTISDYIAAKLAGKAVPVMDSSNAASLGMYDVLNGNFRIDALSLSGIGCTFLPEIHSAVCLGNGSLGIPVFTAIGDNQASFLGSVGSHANAVLVNMGTGGQVSIYTQDYLETNTLEIRPFPDGGYLLVGASLCGGRSYALLESFFRSTVKMITGEEISAYAAMERALDASAELTDAPTAVTTYQGTRSEPTRRGAFLDISETNFTPEHFIHSVMTGMVQELYSFYEDYLQTGGTPAAMLVGSGNGLRRNRHLCRLFEKRFGCPLLLSDNLEEAACGAAIYALRHIT